MNAFCELPACHNIAGVLLQQTKGPRIRVCVEHLLGSLDAHDGTVLSFWKIVVPTCSRPGCSKDVLAYLPGHADDLHPLCQQHLDDLSWVDLRTELLPDRPGWSHG